MTDSTKRMLKEFGLLSGAKQRPSKVSSESAQKKQDLPEPALGMPNILEQCLSSTAKKAKEITS
ncbi:MAG: hypothetical protein K0U37_06470 [Gammaproteobacteria bacterium]|nr:hypothetical protein [Gammaproteobacteria bacterium]